VVVERSDGKEQPRSASRRRTVVPPSMPPPAVTEPVVATQQAPVRAAAGVVKQSELPAGADLLEILSSRSVEVIDPAQFRWWIRDHQLEVPATVQPSG
jgi:hypothetical protein